MILSTGCMDKMWWKFPKLPKIPSRYLASNYFTIKLELLMETFDFRFWSPQITPPPKNKNWSWKTYRKVTVSFQCKIGIIPRVHGMFHLGTLSCTTTFCKVRFPWHYSVEFLKRHAVNYPDLLLFLIFTKKNVPKFHFCVWLSEQLSKCTECRLSI